MEYSQISDPVSEAFPIPVLVSEQLQYIVLRLDPSYAQVYLMHWVWNSAGGQTRHSVLKSPKSDRYFKHLILALKYVTSQSC